MFHHRCISLLTLMLLGACQVGGALPPMEVSATLVPTRTTFATSTFPPSPLHPTPTPTPIPSSTSTISPSPLPPTDSPTPTVEPITTLLFTGVIVPARCVQAALDAIGQPDYPYEEVKEVISQADLAVGVFNATMSDQVKHTGCTPTYQLVGSPANADALARAGFDMMSVATNHIKDCGPMKSWCNSTFFDTLANLKRVEILTVGAGANLAEALQPVVVTLNGVRFGFVALGDSKMDEIIFATDNQPGIAKLNEENIQAAVHAARQVADVVIVMPHWGSENNFVPNWNQLTQAESLVAAGADLIVGNHTHVVQGLETFHSIPVFYGLGNFVFDQSPRDHRQGVILLVKFQGKQYIGYEMIPIHTDQDGRVHIASPEEAAEILQNIRRASNKIR
jgi:poly-gamma-glutamate capsule biosynthesis protein CapA/YwtB (metallophosphatase superfamily)